MNIRRKVVSPLSLAQNEAKRKAKALKRIRLRCANALGLLLGEGLSYESSHGKGLEVLDAESAEPENRHKWKGTVARNIALMDAVLHTLNNGSHAKFDEAVAAITEEDHYFEPHESSGEEFSASTVFLQPADVARRLRGVLAQALPTYTATYRARVKRSGRPSRLIRYWLPASMLLVGASHSPFGSPC